MKKIITFTLFLLPLLLTAENVPQTNTSIMQSVSNQKETFSLPPLPYGFKALEPYIDARTMEIHWGRHHQSYVDSLNRHIAGTQWQSLTLEELFAKASKIPKPILNNAGGHYNHSFYWTIMRPSNGSTEIPERVKKKISEEFGSLFAFKEQFRNAGLSQFGSGWVWLILQSDGALKIVSTSNQDNPLMDTQEARGKPILTCDVWEHAYYLKYQNQRGDYIDAFWNLIDWNRVETLLF